MSGVFCHLQALSLPHPVCVHIYHRPLLHSTQSQEEDHAAVISFGPLKISVAGSASVAEGGDTEGSALLGSWHAKTLKSCRVKHPLLLGVPS